MQYLKRPQQVRVDPQSEERQAKLMRGRVIYLGILGLFSLWLVDFLIGDFFYFRGNGIVLAERAALASEFPVTVRDLVVREGDKVEKGRYLGRISSQRVLESVARLTSDLAGHQSQYTQVRVRMETIDAILEAANLRASEAAVARTEYDRLKDGGWLPLFKHGLTVDREFATLVDFETLRVEREVVETEGAHLRQVIEETEGALQDLKRLYADGKLTAPISGVVGRLTVAEGSVVDTGEPIMEVYGARRYVLAYVPTGTLYSLAVGDDITVEYGVATASGRVSRIEPVAAALPAEFQRTFKPVERAQLAWVELDGDNDELPPLFSKVQLTRDYFGFF